MNTRNTGMNIAKFAIIILAAVVTFVCYRLSSSQTRQPTILSQPDNANDLDADDEIRNSSTSPIERSFDSTIPKDIYMLWDKGWDKAPNSSQLCLKSWILHNPEYTMHAFDLPQAESTIKRVEFFPDSIWTNLTIQAKSDIMRIMLLNQTGGVWADASLFCNRPLDSWLSSSESSQPKLDAISFIRYDKKANLSKDIRPWFTSWFIAAPKSSYIIRKVAERIISEKEWYRFSSEYYWLHHLVSQLYHNDTLFKGYVDAGFGVANGMHGHTCIFEGQRMYKRCQMDHWATLINKLENKDNV